MWFAKWNNKKYKLMDDVQIEKSSREVSYTDLILDFSDCKIDDIPFIQQEVKILDGKDNLKFTGFVSDYKLPELRDINTSIKKFNLSLYSPRQLATKRIVTIMRTAMLSEIIAQTLAPLFQDGFILKDINIEDRSITVNLISRTVEEILNYLSNKYGIYWNINEFKEIEVISIDYMLNKVAKKQININNYKKERKGLISISPYAENTDYANIINVKNARIFYEKVDEGNLNITLKNGDRLDFENPIDISKETARRIVGTLQDTQHSYCSNLEIVYNNDSYAQIFYRFEGEKIIPEIKDIATDDSTGAKFVLTMDSTFKNLATGITYKGENTVTINKINSQTCLRYANMKLINWHEIEQKEGKITPSGQIEKVMDVESGWFTVDELITYIRSTFLINDKYVKEVTINCDEDNKLNVGDKIEFDLPEYFTEGTFIITSIKESKDGNKKSRYYLELRNTNLLENFIDLFRKSSDIQEQNSQTEMEYVVEYSEEETVKEIHEINMNEDYNNELNMILRG